MTGLINRYRSHRVPRNNPNRIPSEEDNDFSNGGPIRSYSVIITQLTHHTPASTQTPRIDGIMNNEKPYVPIEHRPLLGVTEAEALTGIPAKIIRANIRAGRLAARMADSTTMRIRRADLDEWLDLLPAWHA